MTTEYELPPERVAELLDSGDAQVVDVRRPEEHEAGHVAGDVHAPLDQVSSLADSLDRSRTVVFYCRSGDRSATAADAFEASGFDAASLAGGIIGWEESGRPIEGEIGHPSGLPPR